MDVEASDSAWAQADCEAGDCGKFWWREVELRDDDDADGWAEGSELQFITLANKRPSHNITGRGRRTFDGYQ